MIRRCLLSKVFFAYLIIISCNNLCSLVSAQDKVAALKQKLTLLSQTTDNTYLANHFKSFLAAIEGKDRLYNKDSAWLSTTFDVFNESYATDNPSKLAPYLDRKWPLIISWASSKDGHVSSLKMRLPKDWDPNKEYPLYVELHGEWLSNNPIDFLTNPFRHPSDIGISYEDGYSIVPWARGNYYYQDISEFDVLDGIKEVEKIVKIDPSRKYLDGMSMGGFGALYIGLRTLNTWAAIGIYAGALWFDPQLTQGESIDKLSSKPVYFVCGKNDDLYSLNIALYQKLSEAGNPNIKFVTFNGSHQYVTKNVEDMYLWMMNFTNNNWKNKTDSSLINQFSCFPNPVKEEIQIKYHVAEPSEVTIDLLDFSGRIITNLDKGHKQTGDFEVNTNVSTLSQGIYICQLKCSKKTESIKIFVIK